MIIANKLIESNRAEYLLYMWQVEDIIRIYQCDIERLQSEYLSKFQLDATTTAQMTEWYSNLCDMMRAEGKTNGGHLQINENVLVGLADLNDELLASEKFPYYKQMYYKVLPYVVELRARKAKTQGEDAPLQPAEEGGKAEFNLLFELLYGVMLLRLKQQPITEETKRAAGDVSALLGQISDYWKAYKAGDLEL